MFAVPGGFHDAWRRRCVYSWPQWSSRPWRSRSGLSRSERQPAAQQSAPRCSVQAWRSNPGASPPGRGRGGRLSCGADAGGSLGRAARLGACTESCVRPGTDFSAGRCAVAHQLQCEATWPCQQWRWALLAIERCGRLRICARQRSWYHVASALKARDPGQRRRTRTRPPLRGSRRARPSTKCRAVWSGNRDAGWRRRDSKCASKRAGVGSSLNARCSGP